MSHEGIRILSAEQAAREAARTPAPLAPEAVIPRKVRVKKTEGTGVEIDWADGHHSHWAFPWLRHACPCATCHEAREKDGREPGTPAPKPHTLFPKFEAPPRPTDVSRVGNYALKFHWSDGHESGIYSWDYLRRVCRCNTCLAARDPLAPAQPATAP